MTRAYRDAIITRRPRAADQAASLLKSAVSAPSALWTEGKSRRKSGAVSFGDATLYFLEYSLGGSLPHSGLSVGLARPKESSGNYEPIRMSVEDLEEFRGGNIPEDEDELD